MGAVCDPDAQSADVRSGGILPILGRIRADFGVFLKKSGRKVFKPPISGYIE
ncbi:hypothetical protein D3C73_1537470 [compost metagenome]